MKVKDIMTAHSVKSCTLKTKLHNAARTMKKGNCGALPVINKKKKVIGLITDRDIALSLAKKHIRPGRTNVGDIISKKVHTVNANANLTDALHQMRTKQIGRVPVIDKKGKLTGIVSMHNLLSNAGKGKGKVEIGTFTARGENLLKTMRAITNRYSNGKGKHN